MSYEAYYQSTVSFTISGSELTAEFHSGRLVEYATITGSVTTSGVWTEDVTNSGVTTSGVLISGSVTQDYYEYKYGIVETSTYTASGTNYGTTVNLTSESATVTSGSTLYIKYGPGDVGQDDTFPSSAVAFEIYQLGYYPINYNVVSQTPTDFYTQAEVDTISGAVNDKLDTHKTSDDHDGRYYTEAQVDAKWTVWSGTIDHNTINNYLVAEHRTIADGNTGVTDLWSADKIETRVVTATGSLTVNHSELNELDYASAAHTGFQPAGNYVTDSEMTTISGDLQTNIDAKGTMSDLVDDTTPQLGGDLDANTHPIVAADHGTAATDQVVNVCYGTGSAPTANTTTIGTLFIKYTA